MVEASVVNLVWIPPSAMHQIDGDKENPTHLVMSKAIDRLSKARGEAFGPLKPRNVLTPATELNKKYSYCSPVTELAANFDEMAGLDGTPKRRLSLSASNTPTPVREAVKLPRRLTDEPSGPTHVDGATEAQSGGSAFSNSERGSCVSSFRRIKSLPAFNDSPMLLADLPTFQLGSPDLPTSSQSEIQWPALAADVMDAADSHSDVPCIQGVVHPRPPSAASDDSCWSQSSQDSQDSGIGKLVRMPVSHTATMRRGKAALGVTVSEHATSTAAADCGTPQRVTSLLAVGSSPALSDILEDSAVDNSPLLRSKLCVDDEEGTDFATDYGFHEGDTQENAGRRPPTISRALSGLFTAPVVHRSAGQEDRGAQTGGVAKNSDSTAAGTAIAAATAASAATSQHRRSLFRRSATCGAHMDLELSAHSGQAAAEPTTVPSFEVRRRRCDSGSDRPKRPEPCSGGADEGVTPASSKRRRATDPGNDDNDSSSSDGSRSTAAVAAICSTLVATASPMVAGSAGGKEPSFLLPAAVPAAAPRSSSKLQRCQSMFEHHSLSLSLSASDPAAAMTGDLVTPCCLPLVKGKHADLKCISPGTMASLLRQEYAHVVESFHIVDCRYPYEFEGGHIQGAINVYSKDDLMDKFLSKPLVPVVQRFAAGARRTIVVFHCEFSSERGPRLSRFLRNLDRQRNNDCYPGLYYPELYLLEGGYKAFFEEFQELCSPQLYKPMLHPDHASDLRMFRGKSKSWAGGEEERIRRAGLRPGLKS